MVNLVPSSSLTHTRPNPRSLNRCLYVRLYTCTQTIQWCCCNEHLRDRYQFQSYKAYLLCRLISTRSKKTFNFKPITLVSDESEKPDPHTRQCLHSCQLPDHWIPLHMATVRDTIRESTLQQLLLQQLQELGCFFSVSFKLLFTELEVFLTLQSNRTLAWRSDDSAVDVESNLSSLVEA